MQPFVQDADFTLYCGDALEVLRELPDRSVHMALTSPPFYGLRDYGTGTWEGGDEGCDHTPEPPEPILYDNGQGQAYTSNNQNWNKKGRQYQGTECPKCGARRIDQQIGLEPTPEEWVERLVQVFREVRRVLRDDGTLWVEVGDSFNSATSARRKSSDANHGAWQLGSDGGQERIKPKDLLGQPWMLAFALRADGWYLRSEIIWAKPNPMPESVTDRPTKAHSTVFLLSKSPRYYFDAEAVREKADPSGPFWSTHPNGQRTPSRTDRRDGRNEVAPNTWLGAVEPGGGRNIRSVWNIATEPFPEAHFATWPQKLCERMILAGTSERGVCPECGAPWVREVERETRPNVSDNRGKHDGTHYRTVSGGVWNDGRRRALLGWRPTCSCHPTITSSLFVPGHSGPTFPPIPATTLDPFMGSGTTAYVARRLGRRSIGIELNPTYAEMAARRMQQQSLLTQEMT